MGVALSFERVSKSFRAPESYLALRDEVTAAVARLRRGRTAAKPRIHALVDVNLQVPEGQSLAIIGSNGSGKTTALKIATRITYPTTGRVRIRGRIGALIEVGTGLHPELTGRENIGIYGRIIGFSRRDIERRFDDIVEFAGVGRALDQPVKQYSTGMQLRLGFSLAAHLEPDILLVDEAMAVGDASFQYRCVERMSKIVREGRTLVFVSHDMNIVETMCERAVLLGAGHVLDDGPATEVVRRYLAEVELEHRAPTAVVTRDHGFSILRVSVHNADGEEVNEVASGTPMAIRLHYRAAEPIRQPVVAVGLSDARLGLFTIASMFVDGQVPDEISGEGYVACVFDDLPLLPRTYAIWGNVRGAGGLEDVVEWQRLRPFRVVGNMRGGIKGAITNSLADAPINIPYTWVIRNAEETSPSGT